MLNILIIIITAHALGNQLIMFLASLLILCMHYIYGSSYPLLREARSELFACYLHSALSVVMLLIPSSSIVMLTIIYYRLVFWSRFKSKLSAKQLISAIVSIWFLAVMIAALWTSFHGEYSSWYCLPFIHHTSFSLLSMMFQVVITIICIACIVAFVTLYFIMISYLRKEEKRVKSMRSKKVSSTRPVFIRCFWSLFLQLSQFILMCIMMWMPMFCDAENVQVYVFIMYVFTVAVSDIYLHAYVILLKRWTKFRKNSKHK